MNKAKLAFLEIICSCVVYSDHYAIDSSAEMLFMLSLLGIFKYLEKSFPFADVNVFYNEQINHTVLIFLDLD